MRDVEKDLNFCSTVLAAPEGGRFCPLKKRFRSRVRGPLDIQSYVNRGRGFELPALLSDKSVSCNRSLLLYLPHEFIQLF